jgi:hypothetical protein
MLQIWHSLEHYAKITDLLTRLFYAILSDGSLLYPQEIGGQLHSVINITFSYALYEARFSESLYSKFRK